MHNEDAVQELKVILDDARKAIQEAINKLSSADTIVSHLTDKEKKDAGLAR